MDQAQGLREAMRAAGVQTPELKHSDMKPEPDWKALWMARKAELARKAEGHCIVHDVETGKDGVKIGAITWEQDFSERFAFEELTAMEQAETFARVRIDMGGQQ